MQEGRTIGYIRISKFLDNSENELDKFKPDKTFIDYSYAKDRNREQLRILLNYIEKGDNVFVFRMDRLAPDVSSLNKIISHIIERQATIFFVKEKLTFSKELSQSTNDLYSIIKKIAEFEESLKKERRHEGPVPKVRQEIFKGGSQKKLTDDQVGLLKHKILLGVAKRDIAKSLGISTTTIYNYLKFMD
jgi:DNA invertase Pin-like site-specific DNA recombinase